MILFLHILKTAGTTLRKEIIEKNYTPEEIGNYYGCMPNDLEMKMKNLPYEKQIKIGCGHFDTGVSNYMTEPFTFITLLRDPVDRVISLFYYLRKLGRPYLDHLSIEDFLTSDIHYIPRLFFNSQTMDLAAEQPGIDKPCLIIGRIKDTTPQKNPPDLEKAKEQVEKHFSVVGITEMFNESIFLMKKQFGWTDISYTRKNINEHPNKDQLPEHVLELIQEKNQLDIELYQWAKKRLEEQILQLNAKSKKELNQFNLKQNGSDEEY